MERLRERRKEIDLMGDNLLAVVKQQKVLYAKQRSAKYVAPFKQSTILKSAYRCISKGRYIQDS